MVKHEAEVHISKEKFDRVNRLLSIDSLEDMTDEELIKNGANTNVSEGIFYVEFDDGSSMNFDLCSGQSNYFDDVVWTDAEDKQDIFLECLYELGDIEVKIFNELYIVKIIVDK